MAFDFAPLGASIAGSLISSALSSREAKKQREWQEAFYQHRHQWEVQDLKAAGLNPILSAMNSAGSVPSGAMATTPDFGASMSQGMSNAQTKRYQDALIKMQQAESESRIQLNSSNERKNDAEANQALANTNLIAKNTIMADHQMDQLIAQTAFTKASTAKEQKVIESIAKDLEFKAVQIETERERQKVLTEQINELKTQQKKNLADAARSGSEAALANARRENEKLNSKVIKAEAEYKVSQKRYNDVQSDYTEAREQMLVFSMGKAESESEFYSSKLGRLTHKLQLGLGIGAGTAKDLATIGLLVK